ncbi:general transcription factor II-I repeat domain-containing protein 2A [Trichonephila inaurata madagascariensis]|uniref:General transcription factor II-I repeat domain-containing protein 2A n=1 Tax=Trichonephila inaurata madagascariensis TaxID=2747483 RepID=A0A8X6XPX9_9ARAC|nr:general transcription factor II-I repeat domain-containing protein 2A [Trichonephila inaurata madagascariensis]
MFSPFSVDIGNVPPELHLEFIHLYCDSVVKCKFLENPSLLAFYSKYVAEYKYPRISKYALLMCSIFGCTCVWEEYFSKMKNIKSETRTRLIDRHLEETLRITTTQIKPDTAALINQKQCQISYSQITTISHR